MELGTVFCWRMKLNVQVTYCFCKRCSYFYPFSPAVVTGCSNGEVRLTQGISANDGIVEYCVDGAWGTMCQRYFSAENAKVVCRQLGLPEGQHLH